MTEALSPADEAAMVAEAELQLAREKRELKAIKKRKRDLEGNARKTARDAAKRRKRRRKRLMKILSSSVIAAIVGAGGSLGAAALERQAPAPAPVIQIVEHQDDGTSATKP